MHRLVISETLEKGTEFSSRLIESRILLQGTDAIYASTVEILAMTSVRLDVVDEPLDRGLVVVVFLTFDDDLGGRASSASIAERSEDRENRGSIHTFL